MQRLITGLVLTILLLSQTFAATTLLPNGSQCFSASTPTSGGTLGPIFTLGTISAGSSYVNGTYTNVPLTGGSGFGAQATIVVASGAVSTITVTNVGQHYASGDTLSAATSTIGGGAGSGFSVPVNSVLTTGTGLIGLLGTITGGTGGTAGTYANVTLTGGAGSGATANITVAGGAVTSVVIINPGTQYVVGDTLSAASGSIGGTTGFSVPVSSITINSSLAGGQVSMFVPNTTTPKATWQDANQVTANPQPIILDANGCATIYGTGTYRQILQDSLGNTIWDKLTTDTSAQQNVFWAGNATGTPNAITLTDPGFNGTDGSIINFFPLSTNTGATTISIAATGFTNISVVKDTTGGPVGLTGGEIIQSGTPNVVSVLYSAAQSNFHLLNTAIASASGANTPFCGAVGLKITNGATPNSVVSLTADQLVMQTPAGLVINRSNVSLTNINITTGTSTSTANGMDGESAGTNNWLYVWAIDNGAAPAGLVSSAAGNGTSPTMPSGYTYKCRLGAMRVDGSGNLLRTLQLGSESQYVVQASGNLPVISTTPGTYYTSTSISTFVPATATELFIAAELGIQYSFPNASGGTGTGSIGVAPNTNYGQPNATGRPPCSINFPITAPTSNTSFTNMNSAICRLVLEGTNIFTGSTTSATNGGTATAVMTLSALGWKDKVNAN